ncbi:MAG: HAD-IIIA family hydrolase, partial [Thermomicrobiales bacterium]
MMRRALFLDRDGVINVDHGYVHRQDNFEFVDGIFDLVEEARRRSFLVVVVTNQAGIGRGYYSEEDFWRLMEWVGSEFERHG